jgi:hypothetical protein
MLTPLGRIVQAELFIPELGWSAARFSETGTGFACAKLSEILPSARDARFVRMTNLLAMLASSE